MVPNSRPILIILILHHQNIVFRVSNRKEGNGDSTGKAFCQNSGGNDSVPINSGGAEPSESSPKGKMWTLMRQGVR